MGLVEREHILMELESRLARCRRGKGQVALLDGPMGVGRTETLWTLGERAVDAGFRFLSVTCSAQERSLPLGMVTQLLQTIDPANAPRQFSADIDPVHLFQNVAATMLGLSLDTPLLVGVDDLYHADELSQQCLLHVARRIGTSRIMIMLTDGPASTQPFTTELLRLPYAHRLTLAPLSDRGVHALLTSTLGEPGATRLAPIVNALSGGNPLLLRALLDDDLDGDGPTVDRYGRTCVACLRRANLDYLRVAHGLAILSESASVTDIGRLMDIDEETVGQAIAAMNAAGPLDDGRFRHPTARLAILNDIPASARQDLHRRAAVLTHDRGAPAEEVARHLVAADAATPSWAPEVLRETAEHALLDKDPEFAAQCLRLASRAVLPERERATLRARLIEAEWQGNPLVAMRHLTPLTSDIDAGRLDRRHLPMVVCALLWYARTEEAARVLDKLRGTGGEPTGTSQDDLRDIEQWLPLAHPPLAAGRTTASSAYQHDLPTALDADPWLRSAATLTNLFIRGRTEDVVNTALQVLCNAHVSRASLWAAEATALALSILLYEDRCVTAEEWCRHLLVNLDPRRTPTMRAVVMALLAEALLRQGDLAAAISHGEAALDQLPAKSWRMAVAMPLGTLVCAHTRAGNREQAARHLTQPVPDPALRSRYGLHYLHARGEYHLATGQHHAALADFLGCGELMRGWGLDNPGIVPWRTSAAEAWLNLGNADQARSLVFDQLGRAVDGSRARAASLRVLAAASTPGRRVQLLSEALDIFEARGDRFEQARVLSDLSRAYHRPDQKRRARLLLRQALHVADLCGAKPLHHKLLGAAGNADALPNPTSDIDSLTEAERRVASLAVMGYTNREISVKLYITASTVEQHLTRVYRKLRVKHRQDLPANLRAEGVKVGRSPHTGA